MRLTMCRFRTDHVSFQKSVADKRRVLETCYGKILSLSGMDIWIWILYFSLYEPIGCRDWYSGILQHGDAPRHKLK